MKPFVSLIIATYNREKPLVRALRSALRQNDGKVEIIVVDQTKKHASPTEQYLKSIKEKVRIIHQPEPSLTKARNNGLKHAKGDIIIYTDDDVELPSDFIEQHLRPYKNPAVVAVAGKITEAHHREYPDASKCKDQTKDWWYITFQLEKEGPIARVGGANMSFRKKALTEIGGFDEKIQGVAWGEETDVSFRLRAKGHTIWFNPRAELTHFSAPEGGTRQEARDISLNPTLYQNQAYLFFKHLKKRQLLNYFLLSYRYFVLRKPVGGKLLKRHWLFLSGFFGGARLARRA